MSFPEEDNSRGEGPQPPNDPGEHAASFEPEDSAPGDATPQPDQDKTAPDFDFPSMDADVAAFRRELDAIQPPTADRLPEEPVFSNVVQVPRRRRRSSRFSERFDSSELGQRLESVVQRAAPSFDFFIFSLLCGFVLAVGYILDAPAILIIGILLSPLLGPWVGTTLSAATGELRFFRQTFGGMFTSLLIVFVTGLLGGLLTRFFQPLTSSQAFLHSRLWWPDLLMLVLGTIILAITFIQSDDKPVIASLMVAYELFLPVSAAGFGLGSGVKGLWPEAGLVFLIHLALSLIISLIILFYMGFRPAGAGGYALTIGSILVGLVVLAGFAGLGSLANVRGDQVTAALPPATATALPSATTVPKAMPVASQLPTATLTVTPPPPSATTSSLTTTPYLAPGLTPYVTPNLTSGATLVPTPIYGRVQSDSGGLVIRVKPGGTSITTVQNGYLVEIQSDPQVVLDGATWVHVIIRTPAHDIDGWVLLSLIVTATPSFSP